MNRSNPQWRDRASMMAMPYPQFEGKHSHDALFSPSDSLEYERRHGLPAFPNWKAAILTYQPGLVRSVVESGDVVGTPGWWAGQTLYTLGGEDGQIVIVGNFGWGAPLAALAIERLIALGVEQVVSIGTAGGLQPKLAIGDTVVCNRAVRDEGVSHHYLPPGMFAAASSALTNRLSAALPDSPVGTSWTIDTPYRETVEEARHYQAEGVLCVEMEAAALMAVAKCRHVEFATGLAISDSLAELEWNPQFRAPETMSGLKRLFRAAVAALKPDG
jgi:uridine phosphorylase